MNFYDEMKLNEDLIIGWRRALHRIPEVGLDLPKTAAYISSVLDKIGIPHERDIGGSGIVGLIEGQKKDPTGEKGGKTIALRADMDGLAVKEETGLPFASTNGNMHACGHDAHSAILLGAAKMLQENREHFSGNVKLLFQAAEEGPGGAKPMIEAGALENPEVSAVIGLHMKGIGDTDSGTVGICYGNLMGCLDRFTLKVKGKGGHGAYPDKGVDPVVMTSQIITALQTIISREVNATESAVLSIGQIHGGSAYNIIPEAVEVEGTVRATSQEVREYIAQRMKEVVEGIALSLRGSAEFEYSFGYPPLVNDTDFTKKFVDSALKIVDRSEIVEIQKPEMGGEDMAYFLDAVPGTFFYLGSSKATDGNVYPFHNSRFDVDEDVFASGSALLAQGAVDWLAAAQGTVDWLVA